MIGTVDERYRALLAAGEIEPDPGQERLIAKLTGLEARLAQHRLARKSSSLGWLFGGTFAGQALAQRVHVPSCG
jgi:cell division protein ZapE